VKSEQQDDLHDELGYRPAGRREIALRDWFSLRGEPTEVAPTPAAFGKLVNRLRVKKWVKENPEKRKTIANRYALKPENLKKSNAGRRRRRRARFIATNPVVTCAECSVQFCSTKPPRGGHPRRFCTELCCARNLQRKQRRAKGERETSCTVCKESGHNARRHTRG
jgi:hypothetical protein